jgi:ribosomal protein S4E
MMFMAEKGNSRYMKRLSTPNFFGVARKRIRYTKKPNPGRHTIERCVSLSLAVKMMGDASTTSESDKAIKSGEVKVNGNVINEPKYPVGLSDTITAGGKSNHIWINAQGKISLSDATSHTVYKVVGKYVAPNGKQMIRLHDGSILHSKAKISVNDSVVLKDGKIEKEIALHDGASCEIIDGVHVGTKGKVVQLNKGTMHKPRTAVIEGNGVRFETPVRNIIVVQ